MDFVEAHQKLIEDAELRGRELLDWARRQRMSRQAFGRVRRPGVQCEWEINPIAIASSWAVRSSGDRCDAYDQFAVRTS